MVKHISIGYMLQLSNPLVGLGVGWGWVGS